MLKKCRTFLKEEEILFQSFVFFLIVLSMWYGWANANLFDFHSEWVQAMGLPERWKGFRFVFPLIFSVIDVIFFGTFLIIYALARKSFWKTVDSF